MKSVIAYTLLFMVYLLGCKKSERTCELNDSNFSGSFKVKSVIYKYSPTDPGTDDFLNWPACRKDDINHFRSDHTVLIEDAGALCFPSGNGTSTWSLSGNTIVMGSQSGTVISFDCNNTVILFPQPVPNETVTLSLIRQ